MSQNKIVSTTREVIENKLLAALEDDEVVAVLATRDDLDHLIECVQRWEDETSQDSNMLQGLIDLRRAMPS